MDLTTPKTTRTCLGCKLELPLEQFRWKSKAHNVRMPRCRPCDQAYRKRYYDSGGKAKANAVSAKCRKKKAAAIAAGTYPTETAHQDRACIECKEIKPYTEFRLQSRHMLMRHPRCHACDKGYRAQCYALNKPKFVASKKRRIAVIRQWLNEIKEADPCRDCAKFWPSYVMDFDHLDPSIKVDKISRMVFTASQEEILAEIAKCELVCSNCHRIRTHTRKHTKKKK